MNEEDAIKRGGPSCIRLPEGSEFGLGKAFRALPLHYSIALEETPESSMNTAILHM